MLEELREARAARRQAVADADELRSALRARVQALLHRLKKLERET